MTTRKRTYTPAQKERQRERSQKWAIDNPERRAESSRRWRENNKEHVRELERKRYARIKAAGTYRCDPCDISFGRERQLERHKNSRKHMEKTNENYTIWCYLIYWDEEKFPTYRYVGSSTYVQGRMYMHRSAIAKDKGLSEAVKLRGDGWKYRVLESHSVSSDEQRRQWEQHYIDLHNTLSPNGLNKCRAHNTPEQKLEQRRESVRQWQETHRDYMRAYDKERSQRPERKEYSKKLREKNKKKKSKYMKAYYAKHKGVKKKDRQ